MFILDAVVLLDRGQGGLARLKTDGISLHSVFDIHEVLDVLLGRGKIDKNMFDKVCKFIEENQFEASSSNEQKDSPTNLPIKPLTYKERGDAVKNSVAKRIFSLMEEKKTNLAFSVDVTTCAEVLRLADIVGPHICILKTHVDILTDFSEGFIESLTALSKKHRFVIFEDRKFADIGSTVTHQYSGGLYNIKSWAELTNAHAVPGDGVVKGLKEASTNADRACLLIAQMSSSGALTDGGYVKSVVDMAERMDDFVIGFISTSVVCHDSRYLHMTPGVSVNMTGDKLGQQYLSPEEVIKNRGCDIIIVGRSIYQSSDPADAAIKYKDAGFKAYDDRINTS